MKYLKKYNDLNVNLTLEYKLDITTSKNFLNWFKNSKVVDKIKFIESTG